MFQSSNTFISPTFKISSSKSFLSPTSTPKPKDIGFNIIWQRRMFCIYLAKWQKLGLDNQNSCRTRSENPSAQLLKWASNVQQPRVQSRPVALCCMPSPTLSLSYPICCHLCCPINKAIKAQKYTLINVTISYCGATQLLFSHEVDFPQRNMVFFLEECMFIVIIQTAVGHRYERS